MKPEVNMTLGGLRRDQTKQAVIALGMGVQEPAVSKMERKSIEHTSLKKLQQYVNALGGTVEVTIVLPDGMKLVL